MIVDSHCHLAMLEPVDGSLDSYIQSAHQFGVETLLNVSVDLETYPQVLSIAEQYDNVYASVGVHPCYEEVQEPTLDILVQEAQNPKIIAIGETGLDYFHCEGDMEWQKERFRTHIKAATKVNKPLIVHTRNAKEDTIAVMKESSAEVPGGVLHCFTEDWKMASQAMDQNFYISFSGIVTFKSAKTLQEVAQKMPKDRILIETDSPYLAPVPHRGKKNQPAYVKHVAEFIAELRNESFEEVAEYTTENFKALFINR